MRIVLTAALITIVGGASADDRTNLAKRYESAERVKALVEAALPLFSDINRACRKVSHLVTELRENWGQDPVRSEAYVRITSCCPVQAMANVTTFANVLPHVLPAPTRYEAVNFAFSTASAVVLDTLESKITDARASVSADCKKVPVLAAILTEAAK